MKWEKFDIFKETDWTQALGTDGNELTTTIWGRVLLSLPQDFLAQDEDWASLRSPHASLTRIHLNQSYLYHPYVSDQDSSRVPSIDTHRAAWMKWEYRALESHTQPPSYSPGTHRVCHENHDPKKSFANSGLWMGPCGVNRKVQPRGILKDPTSSTF